MHPCLCARAARVGASTRPTHHGDGVKRAAHRTQRATGAAGGVVQRRSLAPTLGLQRQHVRRAHAHAPAAAGAARGVWFSLSNRPLTLIHQAQAAMVFVGRLLAPRAPGDAPPVCVPCAHPAGLSPAPNHAAPRVRVGPCARRSAMRASSALAGSSPGLAAPAPPERLGQQRRRQPLHLRPRCVGTGLQCDGGGEQGFDAADDLGLFFNAGSPNRDAHNGHLIDLWHIASRASCVCSEVSS